MRPRTRLLLAALLLSGVMALASALPTATKHALHTQGSLHPWLHFVGFAVLACLLLRAIRPALLRVFVFVALLLFAYGTEAGESRADGWPIETRDVQVDFAGVVAGSVVALAAGRSSRPRVQRPA